MDLIIKNMFYKVDHVHPVYHNQTFVYRKCYMHSAYTCTAYSIRPCSLTDRAWGAAGGCAAGVTASKAVWVGVELDQPCGRHDGVVSAPLALTERRGPTKGGWGGAGQGSALLPRAPEMRADAEAGEPAAATVKAMQCAAAIHVLPLVH